MMGGITTNRLRSRKIKAFLWLVVSVISCVYVTTTVNAPIEVANNALWVIGFGGLFTIGGQSLVDTMAKYRGAEPPKE